MNYLGLRSMQDFFELFKLTFSTKPLALIEAASPD
jgi:hypothetical protein